MKTPNEERFKRRRKVEGLRNEEEKAASDSTQIEWIEGINAVKPTLNF